MDTGIIWLSAMHDTTHHHPRRIPDVTATRIPALPEATTKLVVIGSGIVIPTTDTIASVCRVGRTAQEDK